MSDNELWGQLMTLEVATKLPLVIPMSEIGIDAYADQDNY